MSQIRQVDYQHLTPGGDPQDTYSSELKIKEELLKDALDQGYSQWRKSVDPEYSQKLSQVKEAIESELRRGYSQWKKVDTESSPGVTQVTPLQSPIIDVLTIEQAIMEKIGTEPPAPSGSVSQVDNNY